MIFVGPWMTLSLFHFALDSYTLCEGASLCWHYKPDVHIVQKKLLEFSGVSPVLLGDNLQAPEHTESEANRQIGDLIDRSVNVHTELPTNNQ